MHSRIRQALLGADTPEFTGIIAWRGTIPMSRLPAHMRQLVGINWIGPGAHVVHYPVHGGGYMNFVGAVERGDWRVESWSTRGTVAECAHDFRGWHDDVHPMIRSIDAPFKWALMGRPPMERWTIRRVALLGDACHPALPMLAQGAVMAIEDGFILARAFDEHSDVEPRWRATRARASTGREGWCSARPTTRSAFTTRRSPIRAARKPTSTANGARNG